MTIGRSRQYIVAVSDEDYEFLSAWLWTFAVSHKGGSLIYARRSVRQGGANVTILMHRVVIERMGLVQPTPRHTVEHGDGNGLNNQRDNLSWLSPKGQMASNRRRYARRAGQFDLGNDADDIPY